jgi:hypothetical protein
LASSPLRTATPPAFAASAIDCTIGSALVGSRIAAIAAPSDSPYQLRQVSLVA